MGRLMLAALLLLALVSPVLADTTRCTTQEDAQAQRWVTTCTDGSGAITRYNAQAQRWRTDVINVPKGEKVLRGWPMVGKAPR